MNLCDLKYDARTKVEENRICIFLWEAASLFQEHPDHIHTWKLFGPTTVLSAGHLAAPLPWLGLGALLKGTAVGVMKEGQA